ncbi:hypothetical protein ABZ636_03800 [Streptomyces sp. NPDC007251]|uniref:hypothetical protein n=1 Tax=Streptomyces sp. NPDC007251 TaxID=3154483 RepID=UPI0033F75255
MNDADRRAWCTQHGINTEIITDQNGQPQLVVDEEGMRRIADLAPNPHQAHALIDQWLAEADAQE